MIDLAINKQGLANNIKKAKENGIIIPTIAQMQHPETIPEKIQEKLKEHALEEFKLELEAADQQEINELVTFRFGKAKEREE